MDKVWAGVEVGKGFHWAHVLDVSGRELLSQKVENDEADIARLIDEALPFALDEQYGNLYGEVLADLGHTFVPDRITRDVNCASGRFGQDQHEPGDWATIPANRPMSRRRPGHPQNTTISGR